MPALQCYQQWRSGLIHVYSVHPAGFISQTFGCHCPYASPLPLRDSIYSASAPTDNSTCVSKAIVCQCRQQWCGMHWSTFCSSTCSASATAVSCWKQLRHALLRPWETVPPSFCAATSCKSYNAMAAALETCHEKHSCWCLAATT